MSIGVTQRERPPSVPIPEIMYPKEKRPNWNTCEQRSRPIKASESYAVLKPPRPGGARICASIVKPNPPGGTTEDNSICRDNSLTFNMSVECTDGLVTTSGPGEPGPPPPPQRGLSQHLIPVFCGHQEIVEASRMSNRARRQSGICLKW
jgi:hypothetical protein